MIQVNYLGHSCFLITIDGVSILTDPFITPNELAKKIDITTLKPDYIYISHGHEDHVADALQIAQNSNATLISNWEIVNWFQKKGVQKTHPMNTGGSWDFNFGKIHLVKAEHSSSMPDGAYGGNPNGCVIETKQGTFYYSGDTALTYDMKLIGEKFKLDFAFLPIGDNFTMGISDAIQASNFIQCKKIIGMHYDTFGYIKIDHENAFQLFQKNGLTLHLMEIGSISNF